MNTSINKNKNYSLIVLLISLFLITSCGLYKRSDVSDNPINDILGAKKCINATTLQKISSDTPVGVGECEPHASFKNFSELRKLIAEIAVNK